MKERDCSQMAGSSTATNVILECHGALLALYHDLVCSGGFLRDTMVGFTR